jgi:hypothetical protein
MLKGETLTKYEYHLHLACVTTVASAQGKERLRIFLIYGDKSFRIKILNVKYNNHIYPQKSKIICV